MLTVSQVVEEIISKEPFLQELLSENLINLSALSRKLKPEIEKKLMKKTNESAVVMALKRRVPVLESFSSEIIKELSNITGDITIRSQLSDYTYENSSSINRCHKDLIKYLSDKQDVFYTYSKGVRETTIILSTSVSGIVKTTFKNERLIDKTEGLASLTINLPESNKTIPGLYYYILKNIAWAGINIFEVISTTNEFTLIVSDDAIDKTFSVIKSM